MAGDELTDRLATLPGFADIPRAELEWLVAHGRYVVYEAGDVPAPRGQPTEFMMIVISGRIVIRVDHGTGPRTVIEWRSGDVTGILPYSRMRGVPGETYATERSESLEVHIRHFPEMTRQCPTFTARTVHVMVDRARRFSAVQLHDEKMISLGRLSAGLSHELNNPASATVRAAKSLLDGLENADRAARAIGALQLDAEQIETIEQVRSRSLEPADSGLSPIDAADRQDALEDWLDRHDAPPDLADSLSETALTQADLDELAGALPRDAFDAALRWIAAGSAQHALAADIDRAATRIHDLVSAVKRFTYMDRMAGPEQVDIGPGLRDTIRVVNSKAKSKSASIALHVEPELPHVRANGGELNQVWLNLIDNAIDAIAESGHIDIEARREVDRVVVAIIDDGGGIPVDVQPRIFDAFYTTKPPGQGTGLGLDIVQRLVRQHDGEISVESRPGRTVFRVSLAIAGDAGDAGG